MLKGLLRFIGTFVGIEMSGRIRNQGRQIYRAPGSQVRNFDQRERNSGQKCILIKKHFTNNYCRVLDYSCPTLYPCSVVQSTQLIFYYESHLSAISQRISNLERRAAGRFTLSDILYTEPHGNPQYWLSTRPGNVSISYSVLRCRSVFGRLWLQV